jgi:hypothetical protein
MESSMRLVRAIVDPELKAKLEELSFDEMLDLSSLYIRWADQIHAHLSFLEDKEELERRQRESGGDEVGFSG